MRNYKYYIYKRFDLLDKFINKKYKDSKNNLKYITQLT